MNKEELVGAIQELPKFERVGIKLEDGREVSNFDAIVIAGDNSEPAFAISVVSKKYRLVQFEEVFMKLLNEIQEEIEGDVFHYLGKAYLLVFPKGEEYRIDEKRVGLLIKNSVDKSWAITISFVLDVNGRLMILPSGRYKAKGFRRKHLGKVRIATFDFIKFINKSKEVWKTIIEKMGDTYIDSDKVDELLKLCGMKRKKGLRNRIMWLSRDGKVNLWEAFIEIVKSISQGKYKSEIHRISKIERVTSVVINYAIALEI